uniref:Ion_trans domain-containing protein n=1 Tax=Parastrongyloides trichosuri TaxID=131310 RepID=A0A0N4ZXG9_PARTI
MAYSCRIDAIDRATNSSIEIKTRVSRYCKSLLSLKKTIGILLRSLLGNVQDVVVGTENEDLNVMLIHKVKIERFREPTLIKGYKIQLMISPYNENITNEVTDVSDVLDKSKLEQNTTFEYLFGLIELKSYNTYVFNWDKMLSKIKDEETYGFKIEIYNKIAVDNLKFSYIASYKENNIFYDLIENPILCTIHQCDLGYIIVSKDHDNTYFSTKYNDSITIEDAILVSLSTETKKLILYNVPYNERNIRLTICPFEFWVHKPSKIIQYIPRYGKNDGVILPSSEEAHIIVPILNDSIFSDFMDCGILKITNANVNVGFKKIEDKSEPNYGENIETILESQFTCGNDENVDDYFHFIYLEYMNKSSDVKWIFRKYDMGTKNFLFAGSSIYMYKKKIIENKMKNTLSNRRLSEDKIIVSPTCVRKLMIKNIQVLPSLPANYTLKYDESMNLYYYAINRNSFEKENEIKCRTKIQNDSNGQYNNFFKNVIHFDVIGIDKSGNEIIITKIENLKNIYNFKYFTCKVKESINKDYNYTYKLMKTYFIPENNSEFDLGHVNASFPERIIAYCDIDFVIQGSLIDMAVHINENISVTTGKITELKNLSKDFKYDGDNKVEYINSSYINVTDVMCTYETIIKTVFYTIQLYDYEEEIKYDDMDEKNDDEDSEFDHGEMGAIIKERKRKFGQFKKIKHRKRLSRSSYWTDASMDTNGTLSNTGLWARNNTKMANVGKKGMIKKTCTTISEGSGIQLST